MGLYGNLHQSSDCSRGCRDRSLSVQLQPEKDQGRRVLVSPEWSRPGLGPWEMVRIGWLINCINSLARKYMECSGRLQAGLSFYLKPSGTLFPDSGAPGNIPGCNPLRERTNLRVYIKEPRSKEPPIIDHQSFYKPKAGSCPDNKTLIPF